MICGECTHPILDHDPLAIHRLEPVHSECLVRRLGGIRRIDDLISTEIMHALWVFDGNKEAAAKALGISTRTIYRKMNGGGK
ncbi:MAG: helix-turn-helix domain-containing protein [Rhodospirillales bacterium]